MISYEKWNLFNDYREEWEMTNWQEAALALQHIKRYHMHDLSRVQNVAEHSYNVTMLVLETSMWWMHRKRTEGFGEGIEIQSYREAGVLRRVIRALIHDLPERFTGDLDYNVKSNLMLNGTWEKMEDTMVMDFTASLPSYMKSVVREFADCDEDNLDYCIIKQADYLELTHYCIDDAERGNKKSLGIAKNGFKVTHKYDHQDLESVECPLRQLEYALKIKFRKLGGQ